MSYLSHALVATCENSSTSESSESGASWSRSSVATFSKPWCLLSRDPRFKPFSCFPLIPSTDEDKDPFFRCLTCNRPDKDEKKNAYKYIFNTKGSPWFTLIYLSYIWKSSLTCTKTSLLNNSLSIHTASTCSYDEGECCQHYDRNSKKS